MRGIAETETDSYFKDAINYYKQVTKEWLEQPISVINAYGTNLISKPRNFLFLYPDYRVAFAPFEPRGFAPFFTSSAFVNYVLDHSLFDLLYVNTDELNYFENWLFDYQLNISSRDWFQHDQMPLTFLDRLASKLEERKANQSADLNILYLQLGNTSFNQNNSEKGIAYLKNIQLDKLANSVQTNNFFINSYSFELIGKAIAYLAANNQFDIAYSFINVFKKEINRSSLYAFASQQVSLSKQNKEVAQRLLDSARAEMNRLDNPRFFQPNRHQVAIALMLSDPKKNSNEAYRIIKNTFSKFDAITRFSRAYAFYGNLYQAQQQAPQLISASDRSFFLEGTMNGFNLNRGIKKEWAKYKDNQIIFNRGFPNYINENE